MHYSKLIIIFMAFGFSVQFELGKLYYFEDKYENDKRRGLYRGQLSPDNSYLSAEMLFDGEKQAKREILLFKFGEEPCEPDQGFKLRFYGKKHRKKKGKIYNAYLVEWSNFQNNPEFSYVHYEHNKNGLYQSYYDFDQSYFKINPDRLSSKNLFGEDLDIDAITGYTSVKDYDKLEDDDENIDAYFISYLSEEKKNKIVTSYSRFDNRILFDSSVANDTIKNPQDITVFYTGTDFDAVVTFTGGQYEEDLYYFCNIAQKEEINPTYKPLGIFPRDSIYLRKGKQNYYAPYRNQFSPSFSPDGSYVGFLNQKIGSNSNKPIIDLYVFKTEDRKKFCNNKHKYNGKERYHLVASDIINVNDFDRTSETAMDYAWYPKDNYNIIFYAKKIDNEYQIRVYDIDDKKESILFRSTHRLGYLSISDDGNYIIFNFRKIDEDFENCGDYADCKKNKTAQKIVVAELILK